MGFLFFIFFFSGTTTNGASRRLNARVSANGVDRGEIFTRVKASTRGRELSRHGTKLIFPAAEEGGEGCAHAREAPLPVHEEFLADFSIPVDERRVEWLKLTEWNWWISKKNLIVFFFYLLGWKVFEETEVVCRRMLKKILKCFREDVIVEEFIQASGEILIYFFMKVTILSFYAS